MDESDSGNRKSGNEPTVHKEKLRDSGRSSPDANCPICLGPIENKAFASGCMHSFCKICLFEWSKMKAVCPICRQPFESIYHNIRAEDDYDEQRIEPQPQCQRGGRRGPEVFWRNLDGFGFFSPLPFHYRTTLTPFRRRFLELNYERDYSLPTTAFRRLTVLISDSRRRANAMAANGNNSTSGNQATGLPEVSSTSMQSQFTAIPPPTTSAYRRYIYETDLWVLPCGNGDSHRYRETSAEFYIGNPACTHRLVPWLNRELVGLLGEIRNVQSVLRQIMKGIHEHDILSKQFYNLIQPYFLNHSVHFIHEFFNFARSCHDIEAYTRIAKYVPKRLASFIDAHELEDSPPLPPPSGCAASASMRLTLSGPSNITEAEASRIRRNKRKITSRRFFNDETINNSDTNNDDSIIIVDTPDSVSSRLSETSEAVKSIINSCDSNNKTSKIVSPKAPSLPSSSPSSTVLTPNDSSTPESINVTLIDDFDNPQPGPSGVRLPCVTPTPLYDDSDDDSDNEHLPKINKNWSDESDIDVGTNENNIQTNMNNDDDSDVEIIGYRRPMHLRTPEVIELDSDTEDERNVREQNELKLLEKAMDEMADGEKKVNVDVNEDEPMKNLQTFNRKECRKEKKCKHKHKERKHRSKSKHRKCHKVKRNRSPSTSNDDDENQETFNRKTEHSPAKRGRHLPSVVVSISKCVKDI